MKLYAVFSRGALKIEEVPKKRGSPRKLPQLPHPIFTTADICIYIIKFQTTRFLKFNICFILFVPRDCFASWARQGAVINLKKQNKWIRIQFKQSAGMPAKNIKQQQEQNYCCNIGR